MFECDSREDFVPINERKCESLLWVFVLNTMQNTNSIQNKTHDYCHVFCFCSVFVLQNYINEKIKTSEHHNKLAQPWKTQLNKGNTSHFIACWLCLCVALDVLWCVVKGTAVIDGRSTSIIMKYMLEKLTGSQQWGPKPSIYGKIYLYGW